MLTRSRSSRTTHNEINPHHASKRCKYGRPEWHSRWVFLLLGCLIQNQCSAFHPHLGSPTAKSSLYKKENKFPIAAGSNQEGVLLTRSGTYRTELHMSKNDDGGIQGVLFSVAGVVIIALFVGSSFLPMLGGAEKDLSIADSVVTRQDAPGKLQNYEARGDQLSRSSIQEKLNTVPVFYLEDTDNVMGRDIFMSYEDAKEKAGASSLAVKATTLDQVAYPLVLKRDRTKMSAPPVAVRKAEEQVAAKGDKSYRLVPSQAAAKDAASFKMNLADGDIPLYVADRLAFAGPRGPQLPLFLEKADCVTSYQRLRGSSSALPEAPNIRTTTLMDTLASMEKGTRPGLSQLAFYSSAEDLTKADEMMMQP